MADFTTILYEVDGPVATITMVRPQVAAALGALEQREAAM